MNLKQQIIEAIESVPEDRLEELLAVVRRFAQHSVQHSQDQDTRPILERLQDIKINGPRDFSTNLDLYLSGEKKIEENLP